MRRPKPAHRARLACFMHAASVNPEPGSNSPKKRCSPLARVECKRPTRPARDPADAGAPGPSRKVVSTLQMSRIFPFARRSGWELHRAGSGGDVPTRATCGLYRSGTPSSTREGHRRRLRIRRGRHHTRSDSPYSPGTPPETGGDSRRRRLRPPGSGAQRRPAPRRLIGVLEVGAGGRPWARRVAEPPPRPGARRGNGPSPPPRRRDRSR